MASDVPVASIEVPEEIPASNLWSRFYTWLLATFAAIAVILAAAGLFGVISYSVTLRTREIGIRMALGAHRSQILYEIMRQGVVIVLIGVFIGNRPEPRESPHFGNGSLGMIFLSQSRALKPDCY